MKIPETTRVFRYLPGCLLKVGGPDAATFLQGQFTNDLSRLSAGQSVYGLWLDRKGHVIGDSHVIPAPLGIFWVASVSSSASSIARHLGDHIIADDVEIGDETAAWRGLAVIGAGAGGWLAAEPRAGLVFRGRRSAAENWEWIFPESEFASVAAASAGARAFDFADIERIRIAAGIPSVPADIGAADLPNEGGLDSQAISYSKGCYLGQEVMARIKSRGRVRRTLVRVTGTGSIPQLPAALWRSERREGEWRSAVPDAGGFAGLALVSVSIAQPGTSFSLSQSANPTVEIAGAA